jgi:hypothetical protein
MARFNAFICAFALAALFPTHILAHTWIEQLMVIASNGTFVGEPGFPRGNVLRTDPGFTDTKLVHLLPPNGRAERNVLPTDPMCRPEQASVGAQTNGSPALKAKAGDLVALRYQENGHVSLPGAGKPDNRGTVYIYGTTEPSNEEKFLDVFGSWTADGTGGNGKGRLLATRNYDDGICHQVNGGAISTQRQQQFPHANVLPMGGDIWCQTDITLPTDLDAGAVLTVYWVWDWPTAKSKENPTGTTEIYTSCLDIEIQAGEGSSKNVNFEDGQDVNFAAIKSQLANQFDVKVSGFTDGSVNANADAGPKSSAPKPTTSQAAPPQQSKAPAAPVVPEPSQQGFVTVTVEGPKETVYVTVAPSSSTTPTPTTTPAAGPPQVTPFLNKPSSSSAAAEEVATATVEAIVVVTVTQDDTGFAAYTQLPRIRGRAPKVARR